MAIQFKTEEQRKADKIAKAPKTKLEKTQKVFFILAIIAAVILLLYFIVCFNPALVVVPLLMFWVFTVVVPSVVTVGIIWTVEGYRNYISWITNVLGNSLSLIKDAIEVLLKSLPYVGSAMLAIIATYLILSVFAYKNNKEAKKYYYHLIAGGVIFILALLFMILTFVLLNK